MCVCVQGEQFRDKVFGGVVKWLDNTGIAASAVVLQSWYRSIRQQRQLRLAERAALIIQNMVSLCNKPACAERQQRWC